MRSIVAIQPTDCRVRPNRSAADYLSRSPSTGLVSLLHPIFFNISSFSIISAPHNHCRFT